MSTPLTKDQKIRACALGIGYIYKHRTPGDEQRLIQGVKALAELIGEEEEEEMKKLANQGVEELLEKVKNKASSWPTLNDEPKEKPSPTPDARTLDEYMHEMPHRDRILCIAIGLARVLKLGGKLTDDILAPHIRQLRAMVNEEDIKWCQEYMVETLTKCGCEECKGKLAVINGVKLVNKLDDLINEVAKEEPKAKPDDYDPEDPYRTLSA